MNTVPRRFLLAVIVFAAAGVACTRIEAPRPKSIVVITVDTLRADHLNARVTPALDRLARESITFDLATSVAPITLPAHASMLTATFPPAHGVRDNTVHRLPEGAPTYTAWLRGRGYDTAAFVSAVVLDRRHGLDAGFSTYDDDMGGAPERAAAATLDRARQWLAMRRNAADTKPFFLWLHLFEPHTPYLSGSYEGEVSQIDRQLDAFFATLRADGRWDDLVLSVTSDHGESLGEHGEETHGFFVYDSTIRIPWVLKAPGLTAGRFAPHVRIVDVMPTVVALAGLDAPPGWDRDGVDLVPFLRTGRDPGLDGYAETMLPRNQFQWSELKSLRKGRLKYIDAPRPELYDVIADPAEVRNVAHERGADLARMKALLGTIERRRAAAARPTRAPADIEEKFLALGYIGASPPAEAASGGRLPDPKDKLDVYRLTMSALELSEGGQTDAALSALARAERLDPNVAQVHYLKGTILGGLGRYTDAVPALERTVRLNPRHVAARFRLALAYLRLSRLDDAEKTLQSVLDDEPRNVRALHNLATIAYTRGDLRLAQDLERQAVAIDPAYYDAWNTLGAIYIAAGRADEAIRALNTAIALEPSSGQAQYNLSLALVRAGLHTQAAAAQAKACGLDRRFCR